MTAWVMNDWWNKDKSKGILVPTETKYKGYPVLSIPIDEDGTPMKFGLLKAKAVLRWQPAIEDFVARHEG